MSTGRDKLEDQFIHNEYEEQHIYTKTKRLCCFCKCMLHNPCCKFCASRLVEKDLKNAIQDIDLTDDAKKLLPGKGNLIGESGSLAELKKAHEKDSEGKLLDTMEQIRLRHKLKVTTPKLKTKNAKPVVAAYRREAIITSDIHLSEIKKESSYLDVMDTGRSKLPIVIDCLVTKAALKEIPTPMQRRISKMRPSTTRNSVWSAYSITSSKVFNTGESVKEVQNYCSSVVRELEKNWNLTIPYIKNWIQTYNSIKLSDLGKRNLDKWVVTLYTSSDPMDDMSEFGCLMVRELFIRNCIVYQEKDISVEKHNYRDELRDKLNGGTVLIPCVFIANMKLGGCRMIWALHRLNMMSIVFKHSIVSSAIYDELRFAAMPLRVDMVINVSLKNYPSLELVSERQKIRTHSDSLVKLQEGKEVVKVSKEKWRRISSNSLADTDMFMYTIIKETIKRAFHEMDMIFWKALFPSKAYGDAKQMRLSIQKFLKK